MSDEKWERLIELRKSLGLSQEEAAKKCGVSVVSWSRWERKDSFPDSNFLKKISAGLHVSIDWLLENDEFVGVTPDDRKILSAAAAIIQTKLA